MIVTELELPTWLLASLDARTASPSGGQDRLSLLLQLHPV
jgi:hypothetical protein